MKVIRAKSMGMCFGVRDAISLAFQRGKLGPLTIYGDLVHNETVMSALRDRGIVVQREVREIDTQNVMITAHGASGKAIGKLRERGLHVMEATCPLVHHAHRAVHRLVQQGFHPVIVGQRDHVEVRGLTGDLQEFDVILTEQDVLQMRERARFGIASQTTQPIEKVHQLVKLIRQRFAQAEVRFEDTVCQPTKQRQLAAIDLAENCDVVVVVGGAHSNNTRELVATCRRACDRVHHVQSVADLECQWFTGAESVGLTAGTSTPDGTIDEIEQWLSRLPSGDEQTERESRKAASVYTQLVPTL